MAGYKRETWLGTAWISPDAPVVAGEYGTWTVEFDVGMAGVDDGGRLRLAFRSVTDWAAPQFDTPSGPDYASVRATRDVAFVPSSATTGYALGPGR